MPIYAYRCRSCGEVTDRLFAVAERQDHVHCEHCQGEDTYRVIGRTAYHASEASKPSRLDPKYEKMVDHSMQKSASADEHRLLKQMKPFSSGKGSGEGPGEGGL